MKVAFITIHKGNKDELIKTILSLYSYLDYEVIGGYLIYESGEKSLNENEFCHPKIKYLHSKPIKGITYALNDSQRISKNYFPNTSHYCFLHSGDRFVPEKKAIKHLNSINKLNNAPDFIFWNHCFVDNYRNELYRPDFKNIRFGMTVSHIGTFISHFSHEKLLGYNPKFKLAMDYDFFLRASERKMSYDQYQYQLVEINGFGVSSLNAYKAIKEVSISLKNNLPNHLRFNIIFSRYIFIKSCIRRQILELLLKYPILHKPLRRVFNKRLINTN